LGFDLDGEESNFLVWPPASDLYDCPGAGGKIPFCSVNEFQCPWMSVAVRKDLFTFQLEALMWRMRSMNSLSRAG
jgi:hypothetical protein